MRLLQVDENGEFSLTDHPTDGIPHYAILSHTWGEDHDEVSFKDLTRGPRRTKSGYKKLRFCAEQATRNGLQYFWVDTCCIDKSNAVELQESITSMFAWYKNAANCYVYLSDVRAIELNTSDESVENLWEPEFLRSRWFSRGWTLQELLAPTSVDFFSREGEWLGNKRTLERRIHDITNIPITALRGTDLSEFTVEERLSWAKSRKTKREEDRAYSLLGIFGVYMPLIYGERAYAFHRLQKEIFASPQYRSQTVQASPDAPVMREEPISNSLVDFSIAKRLEQLELTLSTMAPISLSQTMSHSENISGFLLPTRGSSHSQGPSLQSPQLGESTSISASQKPASVDYFETFPSFRPETYTVSEVGPVLFNYDIRAVHSGEFTREYDCSMFFAMTPRRWVRVIVSMTTTIDSPYWNFGEFKSSDHAIKNSHVLPTLFISQLKVFLKRRQNLQQDVHLTMYLGQRLDVDSIQASIKQPGCGNPRIRVGAYLRETMRGINHWICPRYSENLVASQQPLRASWPDNRFIAFFNSQWVMCWRFGANEFHIKYLRYNLQVLHSLRNTPGVNPFHGVMVDEHNSTIIALLCGVPTKGSLLHILKRGIESGQPISWERRERWCRQIIQAVAAVHDKEHVIGDLSRMPDCPVAVDANDNAVLHEFHLTHSHGTKYSRDPPEVRRSLGAGVPVKATRETDLYDLGTLLKRIVNDKYHTSQGKDADTEKHIPRYLVEAIDACSAENPDGRLPAWMLVEDFPPSTEGDSELGAYRNSVKAHSCNRASIRPFPKIECSPNDLAQMEDILKAWDCHISCSICGKRTSDHWFHCSICNSADFDTCADCFRQGIHCYENDHYLTEHQKPYPQEGERYYSCVKENGMRERLDLSQL